MAREIAPAYQWYVKEWRSSRAVQRMSFSERGVYREMLDEQWENLSLPDDPQAVAQIIACTADQEAEVIAAWPVVRRKFVIVEGQPDRIKNLPLERFRKERRAFKRDREEAGKASAAKAVRKADGTFQQRANTLPTAIQQPANSPPTEVQQPSNSHPTPIQPASASASASATASGGADPPPPPTTARSKRPIFTGQKLTVFEWMLDDLDKLLAPHTNAFDLHEWFFTLDRKCTETGEIPPPRDNGEWLKAVTLREAQRRGFQLRVASAPQAGKQTTRLAAALANIATEGQR